MEFLGVFAQIGNRLDGGAAGADDRDPLVRELRQAAVLVAAGVVVVPTAGVKGVAPVVVDAFDARQLRHVGRARRLNDEACADVVPAVGGHVPARRFLIPTEFSHPRLEKRQFVQAVVFADALAVLVDLRCVGILLLRHVAEFLQQRQVAVGLDVALAAGVAVPVPGAAEVGAGFDQQDVFDAPFLKPRRRHHAAEAAADDHHGHFPLQRIPFHRRFDERVLVRIVRIFIHGAQELVVPVVALALVALDAILLPQGVRVEAEVGVLFLEC